MAGISEEQKRNIIQKLERVGAKLPCPRCANTTFTIMDGFFNHPVQTEFDAVVLGGTSVPTVAIVCNRCGFISEHALGALGLLPKQEPEKGEGVKK